MHHPHSAQPFASDDYETLLGHALIAMLGIVLVVGSLYNLFM